MKLGVSLAADWIRGVLVHDEGVCCRSQMIMPIDSRQCVDSVINMIVSMQRAYGLIDAVGISVIQGNLPKWDLVDSFSTSIERAVLSRLRIPCKSFDPAVVALHDLCLPVLSGEQGNIMSAVVDLGCELCVIDGYSHHDLMNHAINFIWTHSPMKRYQPLIDGAAPICYCGEEECIHQYLSKSGIERQYCQLTLQRKSALEIIQGIDGGDASAVRVYRIWMDQLARSLAEPITRFKPTLVVLSGVVTVHPDLPLSLKSTLGRYCDYSYLPQIVSLNYDEYRFAHGAASAFRKTPKYSSTLVIPPKNRCFHK